jgi:hypothetical protein
MHPRESDGYLYLESSKVNAGLKGWRALKDLTKSRFVTNVDFVKDQPLLAFFVGQSGNLHDCIQRNVGRVDEIVHHDDIVVFRQKTGDRMGSNVATPTSDEDRGTYGAHVSSDSIE